MKSNVISSNAARCFPVQMRWVAAAALVLCTFSPTTAGAQEACPPSVSAEVDPQPVLTAPRATQVLADACVPLSIPGDQTPPAYFDHYSWRAFIALVWPASSGQRGVPDQAKRLEKIGDNRGSNGSLISSPPVVFETFKADWEIFQAGGAAPSSWNSNNALMTGGSGTCPMARPGDFMLISVSKFGNSGNIAEAGVGELVSVLVAQNRTFVRYLAAFNEKQFNKILADRLELLENVKNNTFCFDPGSISIKSSWIDMTTIPNSERFHTREAWVVEPFSNACSKVIVGLVGLHIAQKTLSRPQWI